MVLGVVLVLLVCREYSGFGGCSYVTGLQRVFLLRWLFFCYWSADSVLVTVVVLVLLFCSERSGFSGCPCAGGLSWDCLRVIGQRLFCSFGLWLSLWYWSAIILVLVAFYCPGVSDLYCLGVGSRPKQLLVWLILQRVSRILARSNMLLTLG